MFANWKRKYSKQLGCFCIILLLLSCNENSQEKNYISSYLQKEINISKYNKVVIWSEADCYECNSRKFQLISSHLLKSGDKVFGLFFRVSKLKSEMFDKELKKIESVKDWKEIRDNKLMSALAKVTEASSSPYLISLSESGEFIVEFIPL
jgi:hypothetical protein